MDGQRGSIAPTRATRFQDGNERTVYVHDDLQGWLTDPKSDRELTKTVGYRLRELAAGGTCGRRKIVVGKNAGWLRNPIGGGTGGNQFYLWWTASGYPPVKDSDLAPGDVLVRAVRHHDNIDKALDSGTMDDWSPLRAGEVVALQEGSLTPEQVEAASPGGAPVRIIKGYPGSGKTTALWEAASLSWGGKVLYLTFSRGLAKASSDHLAVFASLDSPVDVMTFGELISELSDGQPKIEPSAIGAAIKARELGDELSARSGQLGPWRDQHDALYAELHAHALGRALTIEVGGLPASQGPCLDRNVLIAAREGVLGHAAAERLAFVAQYLAERDRLDDLFPGPRLARNLLDLTDPPLPDRFSDVAAVIVDEVQDLTLVESHLVLSVVARIARYRGVRPQLLVAGDEAQTVRPSGFEWGRFSALMSKALDLKPDAIGEHALTANMRSSASISRVIEATKAHYRKLTKEDRPSGVVYASSDESVEGSVRYVSVADDDAWQTLVSVFAGQPSAQLVYPGARSPAGLTAGPLDIAASDQVKGLDFDLVGVVDAGARHVELDSLAEQAADDPLARVLGRSLADQFRVAISRSRENLVLIDRGGADHADSLHALFADPGPDPMVQVGVEDLRHHLDEVDPLDLVGSIVDEAQRILQDDPNRARTKAKQAYEQLVALRASDDLSEVVELQLPEVRRLLGVACTLATEAPDRRVDQVTALAQEAVEHLDAVSLGNAAQAVVGLRIGRTESWESPASTRLVIAGLDAYGDIAAQLPELEQWVRADVHAWARQVSEAGLPGAVGPGAINAFDRAVDTFTVTNPEMSGWKDRALRRSAEVAEASGDHDWAIVCLGEVEPLPVDDLARNHEAMGNWSDAAAVYENNGRMEDALRCVREIPDLNRAIALARDLDPGIAERLEWISSLIAASADEWTSAGHPITDAERRYVTEAIEAGLERATASDPARPLPAALAPVTPEAPEAQALPAKVPPRSGNDAATVVAEREGETEPTVGYAMQELALELGLTVEECRALCRRLGIRPFGADERVPGPQLGRVRSRLAFERERDLSGDPG